MRFVKDPLNLISLAAALVWAVVGIWFRPIGDFGVETDFYGDFVPFAREWMSGKPSIMLGYRGPFYYLVIGFVSLFGDSFLLAKILSAVCTGISIRIIGGLLRRLWSGTAAVAGVLFLVANPTLIQYSYRACTDLVYLALFASTVALFFSDDRRHYRTWALAGICAGLAYLTRYNGAALVVMGLVAAVVMIRPWKQAAKTALVFCGLWLAVTSGWFLFLWNQTGDPFWNRNFALIAEEVYAPNPQLANLGQLVYSVGFFSLGEVVRLDPTRFFGAMAGNIPEHLWLDIKQLAGPVWAVFGLAGYALSLISGFNRRQLAFVLIGVIAFIFLLPAFYNQRFMLSLLIWWAAGIGLAVHWLITRFAKAAPQPSAATGRGFNERALGPGLLVVLAVVAVMAIGQGIRRSQGLAGGTAMPLAVRKLAENVQELGLSFGPETPIAARKPQIGYYLGAPVVSMASQGRMNNPAASGMRYFMVSDYERRQMPALTPMLTDRPPAQDTPGYRWLAGVRIQDPAGMWQTAALYEVENPGPWTPPDLMAGLTPPAAVPGLDRLDWLRANLARWYLNWTTDRPVVHLFTLMKPESRHHPFILETEGDAHLAAGDYGRAVEIYEELLREAQDPADTILRLSLAHFLAGELEIFESYLGDYANLERYGDNQTLTAWINEAAAQCRVREHVPAAGLLNQIRYLDPEFPVSELHRMLGHCFLNFRHPDQAREAFNKYLELVPGDPEITRILKRDARLK